MTVPSVVRAAIPEDKPELWRLFRLLHKENGLSTMSERKVDYHIDRLLNPANIAADDNGPRGLIGVIGPVGHLEGAIMLGFGSQWYSDDITMDEYLNYVDPAHRVSNHAKTLISYAKHMIDQLAPSYPALRLVIGILSTTRMTAKVRFYEMILGSPCGSFFAYPPPPDVASLKRPMHRQYRTN